MSGQIIIDYDDGHEHNSVEAAGEFTSWVPFALGNVPGTTQYSAMFDGASAGVTYQFKFVVDGEWTLMPGYDTATDDGGNLNHIVVASAQDPDFELPSWPKAERIPQEGDVELDGYEGKMKTPPPTSTDVAAAEESSTNLAADGLTRETTDIDLKPQDPSVKSSTGPKETVETQSQGVETWTRIGDSGAVVMSSSESPECVNTPQDAANSTFGTAYTAERSWVGPGDTLEPTLPVTTSETTATNPAQSVPPTHSETRASYDNSSNSAKQLHDNLMETELSNVDTLKANKNLGNRIEDSTTPLSKDTTSSLPVNDQGLVDADPSSSQTLHDSVTTRRSPQIPSANLETPHNVELSNPAAAAAARASSYAKADVAAIDTMNPSASNNAKSKMTSTGGEHVRSDLDKPGRSNEGEQAGAPFAKGEPATRQSTDAATAKKGSGRIRRFFKRLLD